MDNNKIFIQLNSSDWYTGAILLYGPMLEMARPVAYNSMQLKLAKLNYPVYKKELLVIVWALTKWRTDLLGIPFEVYTDH